MPTVPSPPRQALAARYRAAPDFAAYLRSTEAHRDLWHAVHERARVPDDVAERAGEIRDRFHLLALSEDWCGDAVNLLPVVARLAEGHPLLDLRVLERDENPDIMDTHLTGGRSRSIPVVIVYDRHFNERGWWGPRPAELQAWVLGPGRALSKPDRYREVRRWYARDRGRTTLHEILDLMIPVSAPCGADDG